MIAVLSPAKNMGSEAPCPLPLTQPIFWQEALQLNEQLRELSPWQLESLLKINPQLALKAFAQNQQFSAQYQKGAPAMAAYQGLAYQNLHPQDFTQEDWEFARDHLGILSALYGLLRPTDGIFPYRLEFLCAFKPQGKSLYAYWGNQVYEALFAPGEPVINLASQEYGKLLTPYLTPKDRMVTCHFQVVRRGKRLALATESKMARGQMARFLLRNRLTEPDQLKDFVWQDYRYEPQLSTRDQYIFLKGIPQG